MSWLVWIVVAFLIVVFALAGLGIFLFWLALRMLRKELDEHIERRD